MKIKLKDVRIAFIDLFEPGKKYGKFGAQFRFSKESGYKDLIENTIDEQGTQAFEVKWGAIKKALYANGKIFKIRDGEEKGYEEKYFISVHSILRPEVRGRDATPIAESDRIIYPGCRVDVIMDISAFTNKTGDSVVSVKLLGVQFRGDDTPYVAGVKAETADFELIKGADAEDL